MVYISDNHNLNRNIMTIRIASQQHQLITPHQSREFPVLTPRTPRPERL